MPTTTTAMTTGAFISATFPRGSIAFPAAVASAFQPSCSPLHSPFFSHHTHTRVRPRRVHHHVCSSSATPPPRPPSQPPSEAAPPSLVPKPTPPPPSTNASSSSSLAPKPTMQSDNDSSSSLLDEQNTPQPPRDPSALRTESENRRNQPVKPMRRRARRRQTDDDTLDWDNLPSVPIVRREATPESGEDYWIDLSAAQKSAGVSTGRDDVAAFDLYSNSDDDGGDDGSTTVVSGRGGEIDDSLRDRLKQEVVSPYTQNWILRVTVGIVVLIVLVAIFGGSDKAPIIPVPDL